MAETNTDANETENPRFSLGRVYLKDVSLETPNSPEVFQISSEWTPNVTMEFKVEHRGLSEDTYEVLLTLTVTAADASKTIFLVEVQHGGIFLLRGASDPEHLRQMLNVRCPKQLFPYTRETVDSLIVKAGFPPLMLRPIDFLAMYKSKIANGDSDVQASNERSAS